MNDKTHPEPQEEDRFDRRFDALPDERQKAPGPPPDAPIFRTANQPLTAPEESPRMNSFIQKMKSTTSGIDAIV